MPNALRDLFWKYIDLDEYMAAVSFGRLTPCDPTKDSGQFDAAYPDHPLAARNTKVRLAAIDFFREVAAAAPELFDATVLTALHDSLFDPDAAVRLSAVQTLGILGRRESVQVLDSLGAKEHESEAIREAVREARAVLLGEREARGTKWISPRGQPNWPR
jgi:hypothetical protein